MGMFIAGLDLGSQADFSAICCLQKIERVEAKAVEPVTTATMGQDKPTVKAAPATYHLRHLQRWPLKTSYPVIVNSVHTLLNAPAFKGRDDKGNENSITLVVDETGVGKPIVELLRIGLGSLHPVIGVVITGGDRTRIEGGTMYVPKRDLIATVSVLLQSSRLLIASELPESQSLINELLAFSVRVSQAGHDSYGVGVSEWRTAKNDDMVLSVSLAAWYAERVGSVGSIRGIPKSSLWHSVPAFESPFRDKGWW